MSTKQNGSRLPGTYFGFKDDAGDATLLFGESNVGPKTGKNAKHR